MKNRISAPVDVLKALVGQSLQYETGAFGSSSPPSASTENGSISSAGPETPAGHVFLIRTSDRNRAPARVVRAPAHGPATVMMYSPLSSRLLPPSTI